METLGQRIKLCRKDKRLSQHELAAACGVSQQLISFLENGKVTNTTEIFTFAEVLGVHPHWLSTGLGAKKYDDLIVATEDKTLLELLRRLSTQQKNDAIARFHKLISQNENVVKEYNEREIGQRLMVVTTHSTVPLVTQKR